MGEEADQAESWCCCGFLEWFVGRSAAGLTMLLLRFCGFRKLSNREMSVRVVELEGSFVV